MKEIAVLAGKLTALVIKTFKLGTAATWPGEVALVVDPKLVSKLIPKNAKVVVVAGTNGKTTTSKMITSILGKSVVHNETGANLLNGIASVLLTSKPSDYYVFEADEATLPLILKQVTPTVIVLLNLFRDQLDRYGEVDSITKKWLRALKELTDTHLVINGDDPNMAWIGKSLKLPTHFFGIGDKTLYLDTMQHATDSIFCPNCGTRLIYSGVYFSHLGDFRCPKCHFSHPKNEVASDIWQSPLPGVYNLYNTMAAGLAGLVLGLSETQIVRGLKAFVPAFGRSEKIGNTRIVLSKNPTGFNESLRAVLGSKEKGPLLLVLNDRVPDGRDVSWIWDVDFEVLQNYPDPIFVSGDRALDLGVRLKYAGVKFNLGENLDVSWILPTYSAMLDIRQKLVGRKIL